MAVRKLLDAIIKKQQFHHEVCAATVDQSMKKKHIQGFYRLMGHTEIACKIGFCQYYLPSTGLWKFKYCIILVGITRKQFEVSHYKEISLLLLIEGD